MAGIGFVLRRLTQKETLSGSLQGYLHAAVVSSGPWLLTIIALGTVFLFTSHVTYVTEVAEFRNVIMYNFCFSAVFCSPILILTTRYLADCVYSSDLRMAPGLIGGSLTIMFLILTPVAMLFYFGYTKLTWTESAMAVVHFLVVSTTNIVSVFLSALKNYLTITLSFLVGLTISVLSTVALADSFHISGMLFGFSLGFAFIIAAIIAQVFSEYPKEFRNVFKVVSYLPKYWDVALTALLYSCGAWIDKWIMWMSPQGETSPDGFIMYPHYDSAMFLAYLTIVPSMAVFVMNQETYFFEVYLRFYRGVLGHRSFKTIQKYHAKLEVALMDIGRGVILLQAFICTVVLAMAPKIFTSLGLSLAGLGMFRYGVLGVTFHIFHLFICIFLSYFDYRRGGLIVATTFLITNGLFTCMSVWLGFPFYGYGYFLSCVVTFLVAAVILERYVRQLPYNTFVVNNTAI
ncbi:MAG: exopolysaccharide Pel transporter PelG [Chlamydiales bacterium]|nr:exopolysaccharide Pel transporter PelG [Chlamydiales bacterium]